MIGHYLVDGRVLDSVDLKTLLLTRGVRVDREVHDVLAPVARLSRDPLDASAFFLPDGTVVHLIDLSFHLGHLKEVLKPGFISRLGAMRHLSTPFRLRMDRGQAVLFHDHRPVTRVLFPPATDFYSRTTASGLPYRGNAVLQGLEWLSFPCLWHCEYAAKGEPCQFCHAGAEHRSLARRGKPMPRVPTPEDVAEISAHALGTGLATGVQLTGGSTFKPEAEIDSLCRYLGALFARTPRESMVGETLVYTTPPADPGLSDRLFDHGAHRVAFSLEVWDEDLARTITPGKARHTTRSRHLAALRHVAGKYGPNRACCNFIIGLEPESSLLEGARILASEGIVPVASVWIPFGMPVAGRHRAPGLDYYQRVKEGLAEIYETHRIEPPGGRGLNVCMCRDVATHRAVLIAGHQPTGCLCRACLDGVSKADEKASVLFDSASVPFNRVPPSGPTPLIMAESNTPAETPPESMLPSSAPSVAEPSTVPSPVDLAETSTERPRTAIAASTALELTLFGHGCRSCDEMANRLERALQSLPQAFTVHRTDDLAAMLTAGIGATPALKRGDEILFWGRIPSVEEIRDKLSRLKP